MKKAINAGISRLLPPIGINRSKSNIPTGVDVREEYANAFRTESYNEFWSRVLALSSTSSAHGDSTPTCNPAESTSAARLQSYRLFAENLLDPDQPTVLGLLDQAHPPPNQHALLLNYFVATANASTLCGSLLKDIDQTRVNYRALEATLKSIEPHQTLSQDQLPIALEKLAKFHNSTNPFNFAASQVTLTKIDCSEFLKQLESRREKVNAKLKFRTKLKRCSAWLIVISTASLTVVVVTHAIALLVAAPGCVMGSLELASTGRLVRQVARLDAAAKGTYILIKDMETTSRLVARLSDELDHMRGAVGFWLERGADGSQASVEVVSQLKSSDCGFSQQLDDLEEHLYLCFMTINKARNLVVKEIMDPRPQAPSTSTGSS